MVVRAARDAHERRVGIASLHLEAEDVPVEANALFDVRDPEDQVLQPLEPDAAGAVCAHVVLSLGELHHNDILLAEAAVARLDHLELVLAVEVRRDYRAGLRRRGTLAVRPRRGAMRGSRCGDRGRPRPPDRRRKRAAASLPAWEWSRELAWRRVYRIARRRRGKGLPRPPASRGRRGRSRAPSASPRRAGRRWRARRGSPPASRPRHRTTASADRRDPGSPS